MLTLEQELAVVRRARELIFHKRNWTRTIDGWAMNESRNACSPHDPKVRKFRTRGALARALADLGHGASEPGQASEVWISEQFIRRLEFGNRVYMIDTWEAHRDHSNRDHSVILAGFDKVIASIERNIQAKIT